MKEYLTISQREKIQDKDVAKILDYLERNCCSMRTHYPGLWYTLNNYQLSISFPENEDNVIIGTGPKSSQNIMEIPTKILADNIVGIYASLRDYYLK